MEFRTVYMTAPSREEATRIARALVDERLAACVNLVPGVTSVYQWEGAVTEDQEVVMLAKTLGERVDALVARVVELHSYDCPCVTVLPIAGGLSAYLDWVAQETGSADGGSG